MQMGSRVRALVVSGCVLLLGAGQWRTPLSWECMEGAAGFLRGRGWTIVGSSYEVEGDPNTLDGYLKGCIYRATANWVARVLEKAGVVELDGQRPLSLRLRQGY